ncbi:MAG: DinB family protein [Dehalococcoidia bacterium]|nr:DinB family protein [Dehalococcoidia bacterium]
MDLRDVLVDGITQMTDWMDEALASMTTDQVNWLPEGKTTSAGFSAWHIYRTNDNIVNFVMKKQKPLWMTEGWAERMGLPPVEQGTGMSLDVARGIVINDVANLREYGKVVTADTLDFVKNVDPESFGEIQAIKPLGEMPKYRIYRQILMTHGFMHLGEINLIKGMMGLQFSI